LVSLKPKIDFIHFPLFPKIPLIFSLLVIWLIELGIAISAYLRKGFKMRSNRSSFITDLAYDPKIKEQKDSLGFEHFAQRIADEAMNISSLESVVFGINGEWGEGKTSMINMIRHKLEVEKYTVVDFHPWKTNSGKAITNLFFDILKEGLKWKIVGINWKINLYTEALLHLDKTGFGKMLWQVFASSDSVEEQKEKLRDSMKMLDKNLIVIVDDLDRLSKNEISDVLKLMRDTANFPNLVFIAAYDRKYLNEAIKSEINPYKAKKYMDKIVLWEAQIYKPQPRNYLISLRVNLQDKLSDNLHPEIDKICSIEQEKTKLYDINISLFLNLRTVKRFTNEFIFNFRIVADKVELSDFYYLSLLRFFFHDHYLAFVKVFSDVNLKSENTRMPGTIEHNVKTYFSKMNINNEVNNEKNSHAQTILSLLLASDHKSEKNFAYYHNFPIYFHLGNYFDITRTDFALLIIGTNFKEYKEKILSVTENHKDSVLKLGSWICLDILFQDMSKIKLDIIEQVKLLIWFSAKMKNPLFFDEAYSLIDRFFVDTHYFAENTEKKQTELYDFIMMENLDDDIIWFYLYLARFYKESPTKESFLSACVVFAYIKTKFEEYIKTVKGIDQECILLYYYSYQFLNSNRELENDVDVINSMREKAERYPGDFIKFITVQDGITPHSSNPIRHYQRFVDFLLEIFKDLNKFKDFLKLNDFKEEANRSKVYLKFAENSGFDDIDRPLTKPFLPDDNDYEEYFSDTFTQDELTNWKYKKFE